MIGYRISLKKQSEQEIENILKEYFKFYNTIELKLSLNMFETNKAQSIINISQKTLHNVSYHIPKNLFDDAFDMVSFKNILLSINSLNINKPANFITHFPFTISNLLFEKIKLLNSLNKNILICFENSISNNNDSYFETINNLFPKIREMSDRFYFCLDLGHLFFSTSQNQTQQETLTKLTQKTNIINALKEFHIHSFDKISDHLQLTQGQLNLNQTVEFICNQNKKELPIILETNDVDVFHEGIEQEQLVKNLLLDNIL